MVAGRTRIPRLRIGPARLHWFRFASGGGSGIASGDCGDPSDTGRHSTQSRGRVRWVEGRGVGPAHPQRTRSPDHERAWLRSKTTEPTRRFGCSLSKPSTTFACVPLLPASTTIPNFILPSSSKVLGPSWAVLKLSLIHISEPTR